MEAQILTEEKLDYILDNKREYSPFNLDDYEDGYKYYFTVVVNEDIYTITDNDDEAGWPGVYYHNGYFISKISRRQLDSILWLWKYCVVNSKGKAEDFSPEFIDEYNFSFSYSRELVEQEQKVLGRDV